MNRLLLLGKEKYGNDLFKTLTYTENIKTYVESEREVQLDVMMILLRSKRSIILSMNMMKKREA